MTNCGPGGSGTESCCTSLEVQGGTYYRTYTNDGCGPTGEADPATVSNYRLDKYLVTVGRFRQFVSAWNNGSGWLPSQGSGKHAYLPGGGLSMGAEPGWEASDDGQIALTSTNLGSCPPTTKVLSTWTASVGSQESLPINCVNWWEADAFCIWDGGFLPSEAEWECAAAGGSQQREYPWGSADPGTANQYAIYNCNYPNSANSPIGCTGVSNIASVGTASMGAGAWGQLDLAGELMEWNLDWSSYSSYVNPCTNCADLGSTGYRAIRGGAYSDPLKSAMFGFPLRPPTRFGTPPGSRQGFIGFRCARAP
jgi:formylglycine-generating enzyme required for sulfatase activity